MFNFVYMRKKIFLCDFGELIAEVALFAVDALAWGCLLFSWLFSLPAYSILVRNSDRLGIDKV